MLNEGPGACRISRHGLVAIPRDAHQRRRGRVAIGIDEPERVAAVRETVADAPIVAVGRVAEPLRRTPTENDEALSGWQQRHWGKGEPRALLGVIVTEAPPRQVDGFRSVVEQLDEFVGEGLPGAVAIRVSRTPGARIGQDLVDDDVGANTAQPHLDRIGTIRLAGAGDDDEDG